MARGGLPPQVTVPRIVPPLLSFVAGYVDACLFLALFGLFVAQVTGSFVAAGLEVITHDENALIRIAAIPTFIVAAVATTLLATLIYRKEGRPLAWLLWLETALLASMIASAILESPLRHPSSPGAVAASLFAIGAMGVQSALVRLLMKGIASTNVMTTNTTTLAIDVTEMAIAWRDRRLGREGAARDLAAARARVLVLGPIVGGFLVGTGAGALAYETVGLPSLMVAIVILAALAMRARRW